ncbi:MAG: protein kinase [Myxococcales bacterium]|nr:protein kinase [Myxococcales bacterium]
MEPGIVLDDRFELRAEVRGCALGTVWRGHDRATGGVVGVRAAPGLTAARGDALVAVAAAGVVPVIAHGEAGDGGRYLAVAWLDGETVAARQRAAGLTAHQAVAIATAVARALAALHAHGVAHGAVTLDHVILATDGAVVLREPAARAARPADDVAALGRLLAALATGRQIGTAAARPRNPALPPALAAVLDELRADTGGVTTAAAVADRLAGLTGLDDTLAVRAVTTPAAEETADLRGATPRGPAWIADVSRGEDDDAPAAGVAAATPDLDRERPIAAGLIVRPTDRYQLREVVGQGGLGRVVVAHDRELDRPVAIKELLRRTPAAVERFRREAMITAKLQHPGIVPVHDAGRWPNGAPFYAMKLIEGDDLAHLLEQAPTLAQRLALLPKVIAVCEAIGYAHAQRVVHRDLKPGNVVIGEHGEAMVVDWGLAKELDGTDDGAREPDAYRGDGGAALTQAGDVLGTPAYMAPEQARAEPVDARADVYALGAMLYHLLAGHAPYAAVGTTQTAPGFARRGIRELLAEPPAALPAEVRATVPELAAIVDKAMARAADARYPTALELARELRAFEAGQLVSAHRYTPRAMLARWVRRHRAALSVAAALLAVMAGLGALALVRIVRAERTAQHQRSAAIAASARAEAERARAEAERDVLAVTTAEQVLPIDPTEAVGWLPRTAALPGPLAARALAVTTAATARGVATARVQLRGWIVRVVSAGDGVAAVSAGGDVGLWDADGNPRWRLALGAPGTTVAIGPRGDQVVVGSDDRQLRWWRADGVATVSLPAVATIARFVDADEVAVGTADGAIVRWRRGGAPRAQAVHAGAALALVVLDGDVASVGADGSVARTSASGVRWRAAGHGNGDTELVADGDELVTVGADGWVRRWRATDGAAGAARDLGAPLEQVAVDAAGVVALASAPARRFRWTAAGVEALPLESAIGGLAWPTDGWRAYGDGPAIILERFRDRARLDGHRDRVLALATVAGDRLASGDRVGELRFWRLPAPRTTPLDDAVTAPVACGAGWLVARADGAVVTVDTAGAVTPVGDVVGRPRLVAADRAGDVVAVASDARLRVWRRGALVVDEAIAAPVRLTVDADGAYVAALYADGAVAWRATDGARAAQVPEAIEFAVLAGDRLWTATRDSVRGVALASSAPVIDVRVGAPPGLATPRPGGLAVASGDGQLALLDARGAVVARVDLGVAILTLTARDAWIYAGGADGVVYGWRSSDGQRRVFAAGHARWVHGVDDTTPDHLASWSRSASGVRLWRVDDHATALVPTLTPVLGAASDPTGEWLAVAEKAGTLRIVPLAHAALTATVGADP